MSIYAHTLTKNTGEPQEMESYRGKLLLIVNTASKCGFTKQYEGLENLYSRYKDKGFEILGFPCDQFGHQEPGSDEEIAAFCNINFGDSFSLFKKTDVNGPQTHPMYVELKDQAPGLLGSKRIKWNFTKFLVSKDGTVVKRYAPTTKPEDIAKDIESHLA
jgi:glutathione peroxidase